MADETGTAEAHGADDEQQDDAAHGAADEAQGATSEQSEGPTVDELAAQIAELKRENFAMREEKRRREADAPVISKLQARVAELELDLGKRREREQEQSLRLASTSAASKLGFKDPDLAYELLRGNPSVDWKDDEPANIEKLLTDIAKSRPYLLTSTDFGGGARGSSPASVQPGRDFNTIMRRAVGRDV